MAFSVAIDHLIGPGNVPIPADKTTLSRPKLKRNWDVRPGFGIQGAFCAYTGEGLAVFDATFDFWNEEMELLWDAWANVWLTAPLGVKPAAIGVYHPVLVKAPFTIQNVQVTEIEGWGLVTPGHWQTKLQFLQYRPPIPFKPMKTEPVVPPAQKAAPSKPATEQDIRLAAAAAKFKAAAGGP